jgi:hypothetical protein
MTFVNTGDPWIDYLIISRLGGCYTTPIIQIFQDGRFGIKIDPQLESATQPKAQELLAEASRLLELLLSTTMCSGACRAYSPGTHARKEEDGLLLEFPCNPTRTRSV